MPIHIGEVAIYAKMDVMWCDVFGLQSIFSFARNWCFVNITQLALGSSPWKKWDSGHFLKAGTNLSCSTNFFWNKEAEWIKAAQVSSQYYGGPSNVGQQVPDPSLFGC